MATYPIPTSFNVSPINLFKLYAKSIMNFVGTENKNNPELTKKIYNIYLNMVNLEITDGLEIGMQLVTKFVDKFNDNDVVKPLLKLQCTECLNSMTVSPVLGDTDREVIIKSIHTIAIIFADLEIINHCIKLVADKWEIPEFDSLIKIINAYNSEKFVPNETIVKDMTLLYIVGVMSDAINPTMVTAHLHLNVIFAELIKLGCDVTTSTRNDLCVLIYSSPCIDAQINETNVNWTSLPRHKTLMMIAVECNNLGRAQLLMDRGYDKVIVDKDGRTAYDYIIPDTDNTEAFRQLLQI